MASDMNNPTACREAFEKWAKPQGLRLHVRDMKGCSRFGQYGNDETQMAFEAFCAAWNTLAPDGEAVAWRVVADAGIWDLLNDDERDVIYTDKRDMPSGEELDGFTVTPLYANPCATSAEVERDAARYRYVRESGAEFVHYIGGGSHGLYEEDELDKRIDGVLRDAALANP